MDWFNANWLTILTFVVGVVISWYFYKRSLRRKSLAYTMVDRIVVLPEMRGEDGLAITWHGERVSRVTSTTVAMWNSGTETIDGSDFLAEDPPRIVAGDAVRILRATVASRTRDAIVADIPWSDFGQAHLRFRFLDPGDGMSVEVLHTGGFEALSMKGVVKGVPNGFEPLDRHRASRWFVYGLFAFFIPLVVVIGLGLLFLLGFLMYRVWIEPNFKNLTIAISFLVLLVVIVLPEITASSRSKKPQPLRISGVPDPLAASLGRDYPGRVEDGPEA